MQTFIIVGPNCGGQLIARPLVQVHKLRQSLTEICPQSEVHLVGELPPRVLSVSMATVVQETVQPASA